MAKRRHVNLGRYYTAEMLAAAGILKDTHDVPRWLRRHPNFPRPQYLFGRNVWLKTDIDRFLGTELDVCRDQAKVSTTTHYTLQQLTALGIHSPRIPTYLRKHHFPHPTKVFDINWWLKSEVDEWLKTYVSRFETTHYTVQTLAMRLGLSSRNILRYLKNYPKFPRPKNMFGRDWWRKTVVEDYCHRQEGRQRQSQRRAERYQVETDFNTAHYNAQELAKLLGDQRHWLTSLSDFPRRIGKFGQFWWLKTEVDVWLDQQASLEKTHYTARTLAERLGTNPRQPVAKRLINFPRRQLLLGRSWWLKSEVDAWCKSQLEFEASFYSEDALIVHLRTNVCVWGLRSDPHFPRPQLLRRRKLWLKREVNAYCKMVLALKASHYCVKDICTKQGMTHPTFTMRMKRDPNFPRPKYRFGQYWWPKSEIDTYPWQKRRKEVEQEAKDRNSEHMKRHWRDPAFRKRMSEASSKGWSIKKAAYDALREFGVDMGEGTKPELYKAAYDALRQMGIDMNEME